MTSAALAWSGNESRSELRPARSFRTPKNNTRTCIQEKDTPGDASHQQSGTRKTDRVQDIAVYKALTAELAESTQPSQRKARNQADSFGEEKSQPLWRLAGTTYF